ncbi:hypothetical protein ACTPEF_24180, partial [Clostridioides difficile]
SLIDPEDICDPIKLLSIPTHIELEDEQEDLDPMGEEYTNPAGVKPIHIMHTVLIIENIINVIINIEPLFSSNIAIKPQFFKFIF